MKPQNPFSKRNAYRMKQGMMKAGNNAPLYKTMNRSITVICNPWYRKPVERLLRPQDSILPFGLDIPFVPYL